MINKMQNNTQNYPQNNPSFGMYSSTLRTCTTKWARKSIAVDKAAIAAESQNALSIFKASKLGVFCYSYKLHKNNFLNQLAKTMPSLTVFLKKTEAVGYESNIAPNAAYSALKYSLGKLNAVN